MERRGFELALRSGALHAHAWGRASGRLALCVPGLSANGCSFSFLGEELAGWGRRLVALDLRGRGRGAVERWSRHWEEHFRYDLIEVPGGVRPRTDRQAVMEDFLYGARARPRDLWSALTMDCLLVRSARPLGLGYIVSETDRRR